MRVVYGVRYVPSLLGGVFARGKRIFVFAYYIYYFFYGNTLFSLVQFLILFFTLYSIDFYYLDFIDLFDIFTS